MSRMCSDLAKPATVVVAMSGGVDSSLTAALLKEHGWDVRGVHFLLPGEPRRREASVVATQGVAEYLRVPLEFVNLEESFNTRVIRPFVDLYLRGFTPNPCALCNQAIKFDQLLLYAKAQGISRIATGHYVKVQQANGVFELRRGVDRSKEQSYFLHRLGQRELSRAIFPLGDYRKAETRILAKAKHLPSYLESESQEICFIPGQDYRVLVEEIAGQGIARKGDIVDRDGRKVGEHLGAYGYTIGQRHGLGIASERPYYVMEIRAADNKLVVGRKEDIFSSHVLAEGFTWVSGEPMLGGETLLGQVRYRHRPARGRLAVHSRERVVFEFEEPQWAITPGQALVCYEGEKVLGGGWITKGQGWQNR